MTEIVLASASPRRRELLAMLALPFEVEKTDTDESVQPREAPADYVQRLSREKAEAGAVHHPEAVVIAADTIVVYLGEIMGKPRDEAHAREMLQRLRGQSHRALTGVSVRDGATGKTLTDLCDTKVTMRDMSDEEIDAYIASGETMDKAAAYGIQNIEFAPVAQVVGCPANVMGLPLCHVVRSLRRQGVELPPSPPLECRVQYGYYCTIAEDVMPGLTPTG
ncbi:MAG: septum formation protein Maf [Ardenticatenales bacterium]|nr:septum formation protein Maf [Ardenticatenales bacterium]